MENFQKTIWLRSKQIKEMLHISDSTLHSLRAKGLIPGHKMGKIWFYRLDEINEALDKCSTSNMKGGVENVL